MADHVEVNYDELQGIANQMEARAGEVEQTLRRLASQIDTLRGGGWLGRGADQFYNEMDGEVLPAVQRLINALRQGRTVLSQVAQDFQNAEQESQGIWGFLG